MYAIMYSYPRLSTARHLNAYDPGSVFSTNTISSSVSLLEQIKSLTRRLGADLTPCDKNEVHTCSICMDDTDNNSFVKTKCDHAYHRKCIIEWKRNKNYNGCPLCRT